MDRARRRTLLVYAFYGVLSFAFCHPLFAHPLDLGISDWDQHLFYYAQVLKTLVEYGQPPFWSPWYCGGNVLWQNPQIALLSPAYPLSAIMPLALAMKVNIVFHYWTAFIGMHLLLTRVVGLTFLPVIVYLASVFTLAGGQALHLSVGHSVFLPAFYLPLQLFFFLRAVETKSNRDALLAAALLALMVYNGGLHIVAIAGVAIGFLAVCLAVAQRSWRSVGVFLLMIAFGGPYAAPKLLPAVRFVTSDRFWDTRNPIQHPDRMSLEMMLHAYWDPQQSRESRFEGQTHDWWEYGSYVGGPAVLLMAASIVWAFLYGRVRVGGGVPEPRLARALAVTTLFLTILSAGELGPYAPASLAGHLPFLSHFKIPSRYSMAVVLFGALTAASMLRALGAQLAGAPPLRRAARTAVATLCVLALVRLMWVNGGQLRDVFSVAPLEAGFHFLRAPQAPVMDRDIDPYAPSSPMLRALMRDRAVFYCYEPLQLIRGANPDRAPVFSDGRSRISSIAFTPNRVQFAVMAGNEPSKIFLNQNYAGGWSSNAGRVRLDGESGLPYVTLAADHPGTYAFSFVPPGLIAGAALFAIAVGLSGVVWRIEARRDRSRRSPQRHGGTEDLEVL